MFFLVSWSAIFLCICCYFPKSISSIITIAWLTIWPVVTQTIRLTTPASCPSLFCLPHSVTSGQRWKKPCQINQWSLYVPLKAWTVQTLLMYQVAKEAWPLAPSLTTRPSGDRDPLDRTNTCHLWWHDTGPPIHCGHPCHRAHKKGYGVFVTFGGLDVSTFIKFLGGLNLYMFISLIGLWYFPSPHILYVYCFISIHSLNIIRYVI